MNKHTIKSNITQVQKGIAYLLLISQLLTSCGGLEVEAAAASSDPSVASSEAPLSQPSAVDALASTSLTDMPTDAAGTNMQQLRYLLGLAGEEKVIDVDLAHTNSVSALLAAIKKQHGISNCVCRLVIDKEDYEENDTRPLQPILDLLTSSDTLPTIIKMDNTALAEELLADNYVALEAYKQLGLPQAEIDAITLPPVSDSLLAEARRLQTKGEQPLLVLDLGKSIEELERLCQAKDINVLSRNAEKLRAEACYSATGTGCPRWLLLPGSDHGVLPGSRNKNYDDQVRYMEANYPGYEVAGARELVTIAMLKYLQDGTVLFPKEPGTYGRCKDKFQKAGSSWDGYPISLGGVATSSPSGFGGLVVDFLHVLGFRMRVGLVSMLAS